MDAKTFWETVKTPAVKRVCAAAGTTFPYFKHISAGRSRPSPELARALVEASMGMLTLDELLQPRPRRKGRRDSKSLPNTSLGE